MASRKRSQRRVIEELPLPPSLLEAFEKIEAPMASFHDMDVSSEPTRTKKQRR